MRVLEDMKIKDTLAKISIVAKTMKCGRGSSISAKAKSNTKVRRMSPQGSGVASLKRHLLAPHHDTLNRQCSSRLRLWMLLSGREI